MRLVVIPTRSFMQTRKRSSSSYISLNCFGIAVILFGTAIILFVIEVQMSARALEYHLTDLKDKEDNIF